MLTATATIIDDLWMVRLAASGAAGSVDWWRASGSDRTSIGQGAELVDRTAPLNVPITYWATDTGGGSVVLDPITLHAERPVLSSSMHATTYEVKVLSQSPSGRPRSVYHPVIEPHLPVVSVLQAESPAGELVLDCPDMTVLRQLWAMLSAGDPLILRTCCPGSVFDMTFIAAADFKAELKEESAPAGPWRFTIPFQSTSDAPAAWSPDPDRTYQTVLDEFPTYQAVLDAYPTYQALLDGIPG